MYVCKFIVVKNVNEKIRDPEIEGMCHELPHVGRPFRLFAKPRDTEKGVRALNTNIVTDVSQVGKTYTFKTRSGSEYKVELQ